MKNAVFGLLFGMIVSGLAGWLWLGKPAERGENTAGKEGAVGNKETVQIIHTNGFTILKFSQADEERMGIRTAQLKTMLKKPEIKSYGKVLDPAPLLGLLNEQELLSHSLALATNELNRQYKLLEYQNATARSVEAAEGTVRQIRIQLENVHQRLALGWSAVMDDSNWPGLVKLLVSREQVLVRLDLLMGESFSGKPVAARVALLAAEEPTVTAKYLGPVTTAEPTTQGVGYLFLVKPASVPMSPGATVAGWLQIPGEVQTSVIVPREAAVRREGKLWIFVKTGEGQFKRQEFEGEVLTGLGWLAKGGLTADSQVVISGAQQLLSEEFKTSIKTAD